MADLISRAALLEDLSYCAPELWQDEEYIKAKIMKQPAVDAVPVVFCKDCKYGEPDTNGRGEDMVMCQNKLNPIGYGDWLMPTEFFCADGERRESE